MQTQDAGETLCEAATVPTKSLDAETAWSLRPQSGLWVNRCYAGMQRTRLRHLTKTESMQIGSLVE